MPEFYESLNPDVPLGLVRYALFDFDGTISTIRQGWEEVMGPLMVEMICGSTPPTPAIEREVVAYIDRSTGILTIEQMRWLEEAVARYGLNAEVMSAKAYKRIYNERLLKPVRQRIAALRQPDALMMVGARDFLQALAGCGVELFLVSGTDHEYVLEEAAVLQIGDFFAPHIYGALDEPQANTKEHIIARLLAENDLQGPELVVVGDGPVEIREARRRNAIALGVASDEVERRGMNPRKRARLLDAGADLMIADFSHAEQLAEVLTGKAAP